MEAGRVEAVTTGLLREKVRRYKVGRGEGEVGRVIRENAERVEAEVVVRRMGRRPRRSVCAVI